MYNLVVLMGESGAGKDSMMQAVLEKSWFYRGNMIVVTGIRSGDDFISK